NAPRTLVHRLMASSSIFWSATGYGEDEEKAPWAQEHFGMTTAEAMAGGCVPVGIDRAGQRELARAAVDGYRWRAGGRAGRADPGGRRRRGAARPAVRLGGGPGAAVLRRCVRRALAGDRRPPRPA